MAVTETSSVTVTLDEIDVKEALCRALRLDPSMCVMTCHTRRIEGQNEQFIDKLYLGMGEEDRVLQP